ncbi:hypothetical protein EJB05_34081, partial [Eragrostis curvula]
MATCKAIVLMLLILVAPALSGNMMSGPLRYDYYSSSCPKAEAVVRKTTGEIITKDPTMGAAFLMMFFFDCFTQGCDASLLLDQTEKDAWVEKSFMSSYLRAYGAVDEIKAAVEAVCPGVVSCADILALAARDSTTISGGFSFPMPTGRRDAMASIMYYDFEHSVPDPYSGLQTLIDSFAIRGLDVDDLVALSGAHSFGMSHCIGVVNRLYPTTDATMNATYAEELRKVGPLFNNNRVTDPNELSSQYYSNVLSGQVLFMSDQTLTSRNDTAAKVAFYAGNPLAWKVHFSAAMVKMSGLHVLTGTQGEVRKVCSAINT